MTFHRQVTVTAAAFAVTEAVCALAEVIHPAGGLALSAVIVGAECGIQAWRNQTPRINGHSVKERPTIIHADPDGNRAQVWRLTEEDFERWEVGPLRAFQQGADMIVCRARLDTFHIIDVRDNDPASWHFEQCGRTPYQVDNVAEIPIEALQDLAQVSYLRARLCGTPSYDLVCRHTSEGVLAYRRLIVPQMGSNGLVEHLIIGTVHQRQIIGVISKTL